MTRELLFRKKEGDKTVELYSRTDGDLEVLVEGAWGFLLTPEGLCRLAMYRSLMTPDDTADDTLWREVALHLVMPVPTLFGFRDYLGRVCAIVEKQIEAQQAAAEAAAAAEQEAAEAKG